MSLASGRSLSRLQFAEFAGALGAAAGVAAVTGSSSASSKNMGTLLVREGTPTENRAIAAGLSMAASVISIVPILLVFLVFQHRFVHAMTESALK